MLFPLSVYRFVDGVACGERRGGGCPARLGFRRGECIGNGEECIGSGKGRRNGVETGLAGVIEQARVSLYGAAASCSHYGAESYDGKDDNDTSSLV